MHSPSLDEFLKLAERGNLIPVTRRLLADFETPLSAYRKIRGQGESFLFESVEGGEHLGRYSFVGCNPRALIRQTSDHVDYIENGKITGTFLVKRTTNGGGTVRDGLEVVERVLKKYRPVPLPGLPRFTGGAVGFIGYEFIHDVERTVPRPARNDLHTPTLYFLIAEMVLLLDPKIDDGFIDVHGGREVHRVIIRALLKCSSHPVQFGHGGYLPRRCNAAKVPATAAVSGRD